MYSVIRYCFIRDRFGKGYLYWCCYCILHSPMDRSFETFFLFIVIMPYKSMSALPFYILSQVSGFNAFLLFLSGIEITTWLRCTVVFSSLCTDSIFHNQILVTLYRDNKNTTSKTWVLLKMGDTANNIRFLVYFFTR